MSGLAGMLEESPAQASLSLEEALAESAELTMVDSLITPMPPDEASNAAQNDLASVSPDPSTSAMLVDHQPDADVADAVSAKTGPGQENTPT
jgi:ABC-type branched-subunit amino acid transport system ATPase component